jgi:hypothetical protein
MSSTHAPGQGQPLASNSDESDDHPPRSRDDTIIGTLTISKGYQAIKNNALVVADTAVRQAMWMLRDAHKVRDNIIRHRIAFTQRREVARKDFDLLQHSVMEALGRDPRDTTGGRTIVQWQSAKEHYEILMSRAFNAAEREYWSRMRHVAHAFAQRRGQGARWILRAAGNHLQRWEQEKFESQADKELERARKRKSDPEC